MSVPRHKRLKRPARLQAAKAWIPEYPGKNIVKGYRRHFGVDLECAIRELQMLGVTLDSAYVETVRRTLANRPSKRKAFHADDPSGPVLIESDDHFAYVTGYTEAGFPYGVAWEEIDAEKPSAFSDQKEYGKPVLEEIPF